ncbi:MAG: ribosome-binding factor A [Zhongshania aliphaticivorans]|uniref:Ribosome-binding factor A n=2 Tax=Zhongshania TaxID=1434050 RepID=A0A127M2G1_9GAMM|nr:MULTISPECIES: 30S ribosome-binding factor RbfA [Zhongshania]AMO67418.1 ribosome-binding factor A [Zhongshania aliphaticivorans]EIF42922.1 ribosome-binding factor A [gamma proteobacterium BDW918]MBB5188952.1 ribosome-binding factor A [Zhongshania antarctica]
MKEFSRTARIADFLKRELGSFIQKELRDPRLGMVSVIDAEVSRDMSHAKIYVTVMGKDSAEEAKESLDVLNKASGFLRSQVAKINNARTTPQLRFYYDSSINRGQHISKLIQDAVASDRSRYPEDDGE